MHFDPYSIARVCHEANRAYCEATGDYSQSDWFSAPQWQRDSALNGVIAHLNGSLSPEQSHEAWMAEKTAQGWSYGPVKDEYSKQHPCMLPYHQLPIAQRRKDVLFRNIVNAFKEPL